MTKKTLCLFLFFSSLANALDLRKETILLPRDLAGVKEDVNSNSSSNIKIDLEYKIYDRSLKIRKSSQKDIVSFMENLFWIYKIKNKKLLLKQFTASARIAISKRPVEEISAQFDVLSEIRKPVLDSVQKIKKGYLVRWKDSSFKNERKLYIIHKNGSYKIANMKIDKGDVFFWNSNLFFQYRKFKKYKAKLINGFDRITDLDVKEVHFELKSKKTYLNIFKKNDKIVNLVAIDNYQSTQYAFSDYDKKLGFIKLKFSGKNFKKKQQYEIYYVESTYPIGKVTKDLIANSSSFTLTKN